MMDLGILDCGRSERFTNKLFGKEYFSVFDESKMKEEKKNDLDVKSQNQNEEKNQIEETIKIEIEKKKEGQHLENKEKGEIEGLPKCKELKIENQTNQTKNENEPIENGQKEIKPITQEKKEENNTEEKIKEPIKEADPWMFKMACLSTEEEQEFFLSKLDKKIEKYKELEDQYESMFEEKESKNERRTKGGRLLDYLLMIFYNFLVQRSLNKRTCVEFLQDIILFLEEHLSEYLELLDSFWIQKDKWEEEFYNRINKMREMEEIKSVLIFLNKSFQVRYYYSEVDNQDLSTAAEVKLTEEKESKARSLDRSRNKAQKETKRKEQKTKSSSPQKKKKEGGRKKK